jgi:hypothetical protein
MLLLCFGDKTPQPLNLNSPATTRPKLTPSFAGVLRGSGKLPKLGPRTASASTLSFAYERLEKVLRAFEAESLHSITCTAQAEGAWGPSVTPGCPWIRFAPLAARVVAERQQNAPVSPAESLRVCPRFDTNEHRSCALQPVRAAYFQVPTCPANEIFRRCGLWSTRLLRVQVDFGAGVAKGTAG